MRQKDLELAEMQRLVAAKDRAADALRDQINALRHAYEQKLAAAESGACTKESEASALRAELLAVRAERDTLSQQLQSSDAAAAALEGEAAAQAETLGSRLQAQGRELEQAVAACQRERRDKVWVAPKRVKGGGEG